MKWSPKPQPVPIHKKYDRKVASLMHKARALHGRIRGHNRKAVAIAADCGKTLRQLKAASQHGEWGRMCQDMGIPERTASRYMYLDKHRDYFPEPDECDKSATVADLGVAGLEQYIRDTLDDEEAEAEFDRKSKQKHKVCRPIPQLGLHDFVKHWEQYFHRMDEFLASDEWTVLADRIMHQLADNHPKLRLISRHRPRVRLKD